MPFGPERDPAGVDGRAVGKREARRRTVALLVVLAVATVVRVVYLRWMATQPMSALQFSWGESDMAMAWEWARRIVGGDVLGRDLYHPHLPWMEAIAPAETWRRWRGPTVFFQAPLYAYTLAGMRAAVGESYLAIGACHAALGVLKVALVFALAARYFDTATATVAGLGAALYGPFLLYESLLLRDGLGATVSLLLLLALSRCTTAARGPWMLAGAVFALALSAREVVLPFGVLVAFWIWQRFGGRRPEMARALGAFALGAGLGLAPLVARNVAVGAPPFALSAVAVENIVRGQTADSGHTNFVVPATAAKVLQTADGRVFAAMRGALATYEGDWMRFLRHQAARAAAVFAAHEASDNVNWYFFADRSWLLRYSLRYEVVLGLGLVGVWLARRRVRGDDRIVLYYLAVSVAALQLVPVAGRYRLPLASLLVVYAAVTVVAVARGVRAREWRAIAGPVLASACVTFVSARLLVTPAVIERCRPTEFLLGARAAFMQVDPDAGYESLRACLECVEARGNGTVMPLEFQYFARDFVAVARQVGRAPDAADMLDRLTARYSLDPVLPQLRAAARGPAASVP